MSTIEARETNVAHERLTWDEICKRFPGEWVVIVNADWVNETDFEFGTAEIIAHHTRRKDASPDVKAARARDLDVGCFWTGEISAPFSRFIPR